VVGRGRGIGRLLMLGGISGIAIDDLNTHLLGEGELNGLAGRGSQLGDALLKGLSHFLNLGHSDALVLSEILAGDSGKTDGLVDTGLDGLGVGHIDSGLHRGDNRNVVAGLLGNLLAVVVAIALVAISSISSRLADSDHLGLALLVEGDLHSLGTGGLSLGLVRVGADLVVNLLSGLCADSPGDVIALLLVNDGLPHQLHGVAHSLESGHTHLSLLNHILDRAVVLGVLVAVTVGRSVVAIRRSMVTIRWSSMSIGGSVV